jgi:ribosomal subunit interface protein
MHLTVKGKQLDVGDALRTYVAEQLNTIAGKYFSNPIEATVVFAHDAYLYKADISVHVGRGMLLQSSADATEIYPAFDAACEKVGKRLRRYKRRLRDHHNASERQTTEAANNAALSARESVIHAEPWSNTPDDHVDEEAEGTEPVVIAEMKTTIETMSVAEAVMRMDLGELPALLFRNGAHGELNMIYRRPDGNVGWVDPTSNKGSAA